MLFFNKKKVQKVKILNGQKSSKNGCRPSLGSKEAQKHHLKSFLGNFGPNSDFEKKSPEKYPKIAKNAIFSKFQMWVFGRFWPIIGRNVAD